MPPGARVKAVGGYFLRQTSSHRRMSFNFDAPSAPLLVVFSVAAVQKLRPHEQVALRRAVDAIFAPHIQSHEHMFVTRQNEAPCTENKDTAFLQEFAGFAMEDMVDGDDGEDAHAPVPLESV